MFWYTYFRSKLILPRSFDEDIRRRLSVEEITRFLGALDSTKTQYPNRLKYLVDNPWGFTTGWADTELNYLLYGREVNGKVVEQDIP